MKTTISEYDYLIMNTGYTFRLLDRLGLQVIETEKENTNKDKDPEDTEGVKFYCKHCDGVNIIGTTLLKKLINQNLKVR